MRKLPHFPPEIPDEPLYLRLIYLPPNSGPREDELVPLERSGNVTIKAADAFLCAELKKSRAHGVRLETADGGFIREYTVWDVVRERLGIGRALRIGERERVQRLLPELPPL